MPIKSQNAVILFADFVGSSRLSDTLSPSAYDEVISDFQATGSAILKRLGKELPRELACCDGGIRGDELVLIMALPRNESRNGGDPCTSITGAAARAAIQVAVDLNVRWFLSGSNRPRVSGRATPFRVAVGIHYGPVILSGRTRGNWKKPAPDAAGWSWQPKTPRPQLPEGFAINFAKRVESASREGTTTGIAVSHSFLSTCLRAGLPVRVGPPLRAAAAGFEQREPIYEVLAQDVVISCPALVEKAAPSSKGTSKPPVKRLSNRECLETAFDRDPDRTLWLLELAMETLFLQTEYADAIALGNKALIVAPDTNKAALFYRTGRCHVRLADEGAELVNLQAARRYYKAAATLDPYEAGINLAWVSLKQKDYNKGIKECRRAIASQPHHFWGHYLLADLLARRAGAGDREGAQAALREARRLKPKGAPEYLYKTVEGRLAVIGRRRPDRASAGNRLDEARKAAELARTRIRGKVDRATPFPAEDHYQAGYALRAFRTSRVTRFLSTTLPRLMRELTGNVSAS